MELRSSGSSVFLGVSDHKGKFFDFSQILKNFIHSVIAYQHYSFVTYLLNSDSGCGQIR